MTDNADIRRMFEQVAKQNHELRRRIEKLENAPADLRNAAIDGGKGLLVKSGDETVRLGDTGIEHQGGPTPFPPAPPFVDAGGETVKIQHSGLDVYENIAPRDFRRTQVHVSQTETFEPSLSTLAGFIDAPNGGMTHRLPGGEWYVGVVWETRSGKLSDLSETVLADVAPLVDADEIQEALDQAQERIDEAAAEAQERFDELEEKLGDVAGFDPSEIEQELSEISDGLNEARQDAADMFEQFEGEIAPQALIDKLLAQEAWIGGALLKDGAVEAEHITASESLSAKIGEFLKLSVVDLVAGTGQIDEGVIEKLWSDVVVANMVTAEEAFIGGALIKDNTIDVEKINVTEELTAAVAQFLRVKADMLEANAIDGMTITGSTLQTRPETEQGIKLRAAQNDLIAYDQDGKQRVHIDGTTGSLQVRDGEIVGGYIGTDDTGERVYMQGTTLTARDESNNITTQIGPGGLALQGPGGRLHEIGPHIFGSQFMTAGSGTGVTIPSGTSSTPSGSWASYNPSQIFTAASTRYRCDVTFTVDGVAIAAGRETYLEFDVQATTTSGGTLPGFLVERVFYCGQPLMYMPRAFTISGIANMPPEIAPGDQFRLKWRARGGNFETSGRGLRLSNLQFTLTPA